MNFAVDPTLSAAEQALCRFALTALCDLVRADGASVMLAAGNQLVIRAYLSAEDAPEKKLGLALAVGERVAGKAAQTGEAIIIVGDITKDSRFGRVRKYEKILTGLAVPLMKDGICRGVINLKRTRTQGTFSFFETDLVKAFARHLAECL